MKLEDEPRVIALDAVPDRVNPGNGLDFAGRDIPGKLDTEVVISDMKMPEMVTTDRELAVVARQAQRPDPSRQSRST